MRRLAAAALAAALCAVASAADSGGSASVGCAAPPDLLTITPALTHVAARIREHRPLTIIAVGSSSTQGVGASTPAASYPSRLEVELRRHFPDIAIRVLNRGKGGEDAPEELARLDRDVVAEHPDLVIWQVGTNAVLRRDDLAADDALIRRGVARLNDSDSDVVLMDLQYAPRVIARRSHPLMEQLIADEAKRSRVGLFRRFEIMHWQADESAAGAPMIGPDGLHMSDRGYGCLAVELAEALAANWRSSDKGAKGDQARSGRAAPPDIALMSFP